MAEILPEFAEACRRNGRECADAAVAFNPLPWPAEHYLICLDHLARALAGTYPGNFIAVAEDATKLARDAFDERLVELGQARGNVESGRA